MNFDRHAVLVIMIALIGFTAHAAPIEPKTPPTSPKKAASTQKKTCSHCDELKNVEDQIRAGKSGTDFDGLQLLATSIIDKMPGSKNNLTDAQAARIVGAIDASIARDPARAIIDNNIGRITANRAAFDREIAKLPKSRAEEIRNAINIVLGADDEGNDPEQK